MITLSGKKLYWSHATVIILSKEIASEGILKVIDFYNRDAEAREDIHLVISKEATAKCKAAVPFETATQYFAPV